MQKDATVYSRISMVHKEFLESTAKEQGISVNQLMVRVLARMAALRDQSGKEEFQSFIETGRPGAVEVAGELIERIAWGEHAFTAKRWWWAIEEYQRLENEAGQADGAWRLAQYKLGHCWMDAAEDLCTFSSSRGNEVEWRAALDAADWSLRAAIVYNLRHSSPKGDALRGQVSHAVVAFNLACAWSLRADYDVLKARGFKPQETKKNDDAASEPGSNEKSNWRHDFRGRDPELLRRLETAVSHRLSRAMEQLEGLSHQNFKQPPSDVGFLVRLAKGDPDLKMLRNDSAEFQTWLKNSLKNETVLDTFTKLRAKVPQDVIQAVENLGA